MTKSNTIPKTVALHKILSLIFSGISIGIFLGLFRILIFSPLYLYQIDSKLLYFIIAASTLALAQLTIDKHSILRGSGVPQVRSFITQKRIVKPIHNGSLKFTFIVLLNSLGFSIGSAGPSVFIGVCAGKLVTGKKTTDGDQLSAFGGAGLAAFFSAPLSGFMLSLEELGLKRSLPSIIQAVVIIFSAWLTSYFMTGRQLGLIKSDFSFNFDFTQIMILIVIAIVATTTGYIFKTLLLKSPLLMSSRLKYIFLYIIPILFLMLARRYPEISGGGIILLKSLANASTLTASVIFLFIILKFCFTLSCVITNIPAGLFMPSLSIGGAIGAFIYVASQSILSTSGLSATLFIACGASCFFYILMRRPLLSAFITAELFGDYRLLIILLPILFTVHLIIRRTPDKPLNDTLYNLID